LCSECSDRRFIHGDRTRVDDLTCGKVGKFHNGWTIVDKFIKISRQSEYGRRPGM
jgi:hypothetical protein